MSSLAASGGSLDGPLAKVERAKKHIREFEGEFRAFLDTKPYVIGTKRNPETRQLVYYVVAVGELPASIPSIAGDVLQNLRSSLEHLAYQLVLVGTGGSGPFRHVYFPIADSANEYEANKARQIKGMRQDAIKAIDSIKPYKAGNHQLWMLHRLNNIDKHRLLLTVGSAFRSVDLGALMSVMMRRNMASDPNWAGREVPTMHAFFKPADRMCPLKAGDELFIDAPDAEVNQEMQFAFDVAFSEPQVAESEPILDTLREIIDVVENLIKSFGPLLSHQ
jgi:hypothetical protein